MGLRLLQVGVPMELGLYIANPCYFPPGKRLPLAEHCVQDRPEALQIATELERRLKHSGAQRGTTTEAGTRYVLWALWQLYGPDVGTRLGAAFMPEIAAIADEPPE
jgi:hypothetical protein